MRGSVKKGGLSGIYYLLYNKTEGLSHVGEKGQDGFGATSAICRTGLIKRIKKKMKMLPTVLTL